MPLAPNAANPTRSAMGVQKNAPEQQARFHSTGKRLLSGCQGQWPRTRGEAPVKFHASQPRRGPT